MAGDKINPSLVGGPNENYAQHVALTKGDHPFPQEAGAFTFDRANFERVAGTHGDGTTNLTQSNPLG